MKNTLCAVVLALTAGCSAMPVEKKIEAKPRRLKMHTLDWDNFAIHVLFHQKYPPISKKQKEKDKKLLLRILEYQVEKDKTKFLEKETAFLPLFGLLGRITQSSPEIEFDITSNQGWDYPILRLGNWEGIYDAPRIIVKPKGISLGTFTHEFCHATDRHYSKTQYLFSKAHRCRMEAVAMAGEEHVSDYISCVYEMHELAEYVWQRASMDAIELRSLKRKHKTFEEVYENAHECDTARIMIHILADKFKGDLEKTYFFLRNTDCKKVYQAIYAHLKTINYGLAVQNAITIQTTRLLWRQDNSRKNSSSVKKK